MPDLCMSKIFAMGKEMHKSFIALDSWMPAILHLSEV